VPWILQLLRLFDFLFAIFSKMIRSIYSLIIRSTINAAYICNLLFLFNKLQTYIYIKSKVVLVFLNKNSVIEKVRCSTEDPNRKCFIVFLSGNTQSLGFKD